MDFAKTLRDTVEGEMILAGTLLKGLSKHDVAWVVIEKIQQADQLRVTLHAYWHDVFIVSKVLKINPDNTIEWKETKL